MSGPKVQNISSEDAFNTHVKAQPASALLVIFFHTSWAAPCKQVQSILQALAIQCQSASKPVTFVRIDAEELPELAEKFNVMAVPFVVLQSEGKVVEGLSGTNAGQLRDLVEKYAEMADSTRLDSSASTPPIADAPPADLESTDEDTGLDESLRKRLVDLTNAAPVMLFMKGTPNAPQCGFSRQLVGILRERNVRYGFFNILADETVRQGLKELSEWPTFPQLYTKGELVGGLDIVKEELEQNDAFFSEFSTQA